MKSRCHCGRPARARRLCQAHYKDAQRNGTNRRSATSPVPDTRPPKNDPSDQDFVRNFSHLTQNSRVIVEDGVLRHGAEYQVTGLVCPDCHGEVIGYTGGYPVRRKPDIGWCHSDQHPIFDVTGYLIQMTRPS